MIRNLFGGVALAPTLLGAGTVPAGATPETPDDGSVLPFPPQPMAGVAKPRLQDSTMQWPKEPQCLPDDAPNILIVLIDDVGFGVADTLPSTARSSPSGSS
jgi:arylsulfatase